jgi:hypothetical protein
MPALEHAYQVLKRGGSVSRQPEILGIDGDLDDSHTVQIFARKMGVTYPIVVDTMLSAMTRYHIGEIPTSLFVDPGGKIQATHIGPLSEDQIVRGLQGDFPL